MFLLHPSGAWAQKQAAPPAANHIPALPGWTPTFDEEFNGTRLDPKKWTATDAPPNLQELPVQYYRPDEATVAHGVLTIHTEQNSYRGCDFVCRCTCD